MSAPGFFKSNGHYYAGIAFNGVAEKSWVKLRDEMWPRGGNVYWVNEAFPDGVVLDIETAELPSLLFYEWAELDFAYIAQSS